MADRVALLKARLKALVLENTDIPQCEIVPIGINGFRVAVPRSAHVSMEHFKTIEHVATSREGVTFRGFIEV